MKKTLIKIFLFLLPVLFLKAPALAIDISEFGDFSSRSLIMNNRQQSLTQEQKDLLIQKKLFPTTKCLIEQIKKKHNENVYILLNSNVNPNVSFMAEYPIYIAAKENSFEILQALYEKGAKLDKGFNSELYEAVKNKNREMAFFLLERKANVNYKDSLTENTILYVALKNNMVDVAQELILKGAKPDRKTLLLIKKKKLKNLIQD